MSSLLKDFITKKKMIIGQDIPLNDIGDEYIHADKLPWIVKKTVRIGDENEQNSAPVLIEMPELSDFRYIEKETDLIPEVFNENLNNSQDEAVILEAEPVYEAESFEETAELDFNDDQHVEDSDSSVPDESDVIDLTWSSCEKIKIPQGINKNRIKYIENGLPSKIMHASAYTEVEYEEKSQIDSDDNNIGNYDAEEISYNDQYSEDNYNVNKSDDAENDLPEEDCDNPIEEINFSEEAESEVIYSADEKSENEEEVDVSAERESRDLFEKQRDIQKAQEEEKKKEKVFKDICINDDYIIPMNFLNVSEDRNEESWQSEIRNNSRLLVKTLNDFGIESRVVKVNRGPVVTLYEMQIAPGIKVNRIVGLSDDIAMALAASRVRIVAPIPGKSAIGVEVPNKLREDVTLGDILNTPEYENCKMELQVALGKDILGKPVMLDLKRQPHLLIAGATGAGKSVCVNTIIASIVYKYDPSVVRFIMVDPKMVELQLYNGLPHQLAPVITEPDIAPKALKWAIYEMERRYRLLSEYSTRDIERYNQKIDAHPRSYDLEKLPYIVIIVDELADLMMVAPKEIENYITRIAQKARAVGIHLVLATQRPSVDVITGIIKANFPARIAFQVAQKTDSRTIIDQNGAEKLLGKGDMLYQSPMSSFPVRIQGAFISEDEVQDIVKHARRFGKPQYIDIQEAVDERDEVEAGNVEDEDELFVEAVKIIEETRKASASYLQRRLSIGYNRAARIIERMEELGYVGPPQGSKPREVLV